MKIGDRVSHYEIIEVLGACGMGVPAPFESVVARSLEKDPAARYQSARALLDGVDSLRPQATTLGVARHRQACEHWDESVAAGGTRRCAHCCLRSRRLVSPSHVSVRAAQQLMQRIPAFFEKNGDSSMTIT
jgi:hypothetical protein